jgi:hypothetical protein
MNGIIDNLYTQLETTNSYSATANLPTLQITTTTSKPFPAYVFFSRFLVMASNSGDSSTSRAQVLSSPTPMQNCL